MRRERASGSGALSPFLPPPWGWTAGLRPRRPGMPWSNGGMTEPSFILIPGASGMASYWHWVMPLLEHATSLSGRQPMPRDERAPAFLALGIRRREKREVAMFQVSQTGDSDGFPVNQRVAIRRRVPGFVDWRRMCQVSWTDLQAGRIRRAASPCDFDVGKSGPWQRCGSRFRGPSPLILAPVHETWVPVQETWNTDRRQARGGVSPEF